MNEDDLVAIEFPFLYLTLCAQGRVDVGQNVHGVTRAV